MKLKRFLSVFLVLVMVFALLPAVSVPARAASGDVAINGSNFPDANFNECVRLCLDEDGDGILNADEITNAKTLNVAGCGIKDLTGVEYLTSLITLDCSYNELTTLDVRGLSFLMELSVKGNSSLSELNCSRTTFSSHALTSLDVSGCAALKKLYAQNNNLTCLDLSDNPALETLFACNNKLTELDVSGNTALKKLDCSGNDISSLDLSKNTALQTLRCSSNNALTSLDVSGHSQLTNLVLFYDTALKTLTCSNCALTNLYIENCTVLEHLDCHENSLPSLDVSTCTALKYLYCACNHLSSLDLSNNTALRELDCELNELTALDVSKNTALEMMTCIESGITALDVSACPNLADAVLNGDTYVETVDELTFRIYIKEPYMLGVNQDTTVIAAKPAISSVKANKTSPAVGEKITWTCTAAGGAGDLQYYFILYKDGAKFKTRSYSTKNTYSYTPTEAGTYKVKVYVKDAAGNKVNKTSKGVTVTAVAAPVITTQPKAQTAAAGATATFKVVASGTGLTYQWQYKTAGSSTWKDKSGATKSIYTVTAKESYNGIQYRCVVSNAGGSVTSSAAKLTVTSAVSKPEITTQPKAQTAAAGETATFKVVASGTGLTYQWQYSTDYGKTWTDKAGSTKATHTVTVKASYNGYLYRCKVTNSAGTVTSSKVRLTVSGVKPKILSQPAAASVAAGDSVTFKVVAAGVGMTYQWQYSTNGGTSWKNKTGATSASYTVTAKESYNGILYRCKVTNSIGSVYSNGAMLLVS
ncbi:MAG: leucine-rich repeat domain-containing protein [Oscillospiraceae bacterium]|nr:leucine-rich repeat domain-containing protein [Oscillospiraceae bacterium]